MKVSPFGRLQQGLDVQYSCGTKAWISASRSQIRRSATDWTRPAEASRLGQLAPQDGREPEAHQIVQGAAGLVGVDQVLVELAAVAHGLQHGGLGDLVEHHPLDVDAFQRLAWP